MAEILSYKDTLEDWASYVLNAWNDRMISLGISNADLHAAQFQHFVFSSAGGNLMKVDFFYEWFLKFVDMGVGKGVSLENRKTVITKRIPKQWYSKTFLLEVRKLANILAAKFGHSGVLIIKENIEDNALRWDKSAITNKI